jgi:fucose 4-O-acetylase-like acetyltransferase
MGNGTANAAVTERPEHSTGASTAAGPARGARDPYWDNVRYVAITLVVVGHSIERLDSSDLMATLYFVIYAFHMPLFAFVSGRFSSADPGRPGAVTKLVTQLAVPYVVFSVIWWLFRRTVGGVEDLRLDLARPFWHLWFLVALLVWRLLLPAIARLRHPVLISLVVSVVAGYMPSIGPVLGSGRVFAMLPFFVLGWVARERGWSVPPVPRRMPPLACRVLAAGALLGALAVAYLLVDTIRSWHLREWVQMTDDYAAGQVTQWWAGLLRLGLFGLAVVLAVAVLLLVPRRATRMTGWGRSTMYVYMLHLFPVYVLTTATDAVDWFDSAPRFLLLVLLAVAWSTLLSTAPVRRVLRPLVEPRVDWLFVRPAAAESLPGS